MSHSWSPVQMGKRAPSPLVLWGWTWPLTGAAAQLPIVALTVHVVALAVAPIDNLAGDVAGVAYALATDAVPQPRAHDGVVVLPAASLQLLAAAALRLALAALPDVARLAPGGRGTQSDPLAGHGHLRPSGCHWPKALLSPQRAPDHTGTWAGTSSRGTQRPRPLRVSGGQGQVGTWHCVGRRKQGPGLRHGLRCWLWVGTEQMPASGGVGAMAVRAPHLQTPHSMEPLPPQRPLFCLWSRHRHSHWGRTCTVTVSVKPSARMSKDCGWMHSVAVTFTWKVTCEDSGRTQAGTMGDRVSALLLSLTRPQGTCS